MLPLATIALTQGEHEPLSRTCWVRRITSNALQPMIKLDARRELWTVESKVFADVGRGLADDDDYDCYYCYSPCNLGRRSGQNNLGFARECHGHWSRFIRFSHHSNKGDNSCIVSTRKGCSWVFCGGQHPHRQECNATWSFCICLISHV